LVIQNSNYMQTSTLTSKGQLLIPKNIRVKYGFEAGGKVAFIETVEGLVLKPVNAEFIDDIVNHIGKNFPTLKEYIKWKEEEL